MTLRDFHRAALGIGPDYMGEHAAIFGERCEDCAQALRPSQLVGYSPLKRYDA